MKTRSTAALAVALALLGVVAEARAEDGALDGGTKLATPAPQSVLPPPAAIQIGERHLCTIRLARGPLSPQARAQRATHVLEQALEDGKPAEVRVAIEGPAAVIYVGAAPLVQLETEDAVAASDASLSVHAEACAASVRDGLRTELRRRAIANLVFSISLIVLSGLLSFLLVGAVSRAAARVTALVEARETVSALRVGSLELLTPAAVRVTVLTSISVAKPIVQLSIVIGWVLSSLALLPATEALGRRLTGYVLVPLTTLLGRVGAVLPLLVLVAIGTFAVAMLLRFLRVFFESVAQGGIHLGWLPPEKALPASVVARAVAILGALLAAVPLLTGDSAEWGALRIGGAALTLAVVLSMTPAFANIVIGTLALFSGRLQPGSFIELGAHSGRLLEVGLTELRLEDRSGAEVRVPHFVTLYCPLRVLGESLPSHYEVIVDARAPQGPIRKALADALRRQGRAAHVELTEIEGERAVYHVVGSALPGEEDLASAIADSLTRVGVSFGRIRKLDAA